MIALMVNTNGKQRLYFFLVSLYLWLYLKKSFETYFHLRVNEYATNCIPREKKFRKLNWPVLLIEAVLDMNVIFCLFM